MNEPDPTEESSQWEAPYKEPRSHPWLRFFVWCGPAITIFLFGLLSTSMRFTNPEFFWIIAFLIGIGFGIYDAHLRNLASGGMRPEVTPWVSLFILCQVFFTPLIWLLVVYGWCALASI